MKRICLSLFILGSIQSAETVASLGSGCSNALTRAYYYENSGSLDSASRILDSCGIDTGEFIARDTFEIRQFLALGNTLQARNKILQCSAQPYWRARQNLLLIWKLRVQCMAGVVHTDSILIDPNMPESQEILEIVRIVQSTEKDTLLQQLFGQLHCARYCKMLSLLPNTEKLVFKETRLQQAFFILYAQAANACNALSRAAPLIDTTRSSSAVTAWHYWAGKAYIAAGYQRVGEQLLVNLVSRYPFDPWAIRAREIVRKPVF